MREGYEEDPCYLMEDWRVEQMNTRFKVILTLLVLAAILVIFLVIPMFLVRR